jgi:molybdate transport system substrate-binding protein
MPPTNEDIMMMLSPASLAAASTVLGLAAFLSPSALKAAELKVIAGGSMTTALNQLGPEFEHATGHKVAIHFDSTPNIIKQVTSGEPVDLGVVPVDVFKDAAAKARFGPTTDIARAGYGVAVGAGAPKPDISTPDALKKTLLDAKSIAYLPSSAAGAYVTGVFERLGIGEAMKAKTTAQTSTTAIPQAVAKGEAELGVFLTNVLIAPGVELAGSFPSELQQELVFTAAIATDSKQADAAKAFVDFLRTPAAAATLKAAGLTPG